MNIKSLQSNPNLHVIPYKTNQKKQPKSQCLYYRELGVDKFEGPYCYPNSNEYRIDVTYQDNPEIYSEFLTFILSPKNAFKLHEYIAENYTRFGVKFNKYWQSICKLLPAIINRNWIIFVPGKYLLISWIPSEDQRYTFPGYEPKVAICGGKQIDMKKKYDSFTSYRNIKYKNQTIWFVDYGESWEIVSKSTSNFKRISDMRDHKNLYKIRKMFHGGLKTIRGKLKLNEYGEDFTWKYKFVDFMWEEYLDSKLQQCNIVSEGTSMKKWTCLIAEANFIFDLFKGEQYFERYYGDGNSIYLSNIFMQFGTNSGYLSIEAVTLKRNAKGNVYGIKKLAEDEIDIYSIITCLSLDIIYSIAEYLTKNDWKRMKCVSQVLKTIFTSKSNQETFASAQNKLFKQNNKQNNVEM